MKAYSLKKVKEIVAIYNDTKSIDKVSEKLSLSRLDVKTLLLWLHAHDPGNSERKRGACRADFRLAHPVCRVYLQFLYLHNIAPHVAATCTNMPLQRVLESCGGPEEWAKDSDRAPIKLVNNRVIGAKQESEWQPGELTRAEIVAAAAEVRAKWEPTDPRHPHNKRRRVPLRHYIFDVRDHRFDSAEPAP